MQQTRVSRYFGILLRAESAALSDVFWTESEVEGLAGGLVAANGGKGGIRRLRANLRKTQSVIDDPAEAMRLLMGFHALVIELVPLKSLQLLCKMLRSTANDIISTYTLDAPARLDGVNPRRESLAEHEMFLEMVIAKNPDAGHFWRDHLTSTACAVQERIQVPATTLALPLI